MFDTQSQLIILGERIAIQTIPDNAIISNSKEQLHFGKQLELAVRLSKQYMIKSSTTNNTNLKVLVIIGR
jgi:hypothetical protein